MSRIMSMSRRAAAWAMLKGQSYLMALQSLRAFRFRGTLATLTVFVGLPSILCLAEPVFLPVRATPYDRQMTRVEPVLNLTSHASAGDRVSWPAVNQWMTSLRAIPYRYSSHWQTPAEVGFAQATDCKGKAVTLYAQMRNSGAKNVRIVIGKHHLYDSATHAWLEWETAGGSYTLDPTFNEIPVKTADLYPMTYLPLFAYDGVHKFRVSNAGFLLPTTRVATGSNSRSRVSSVTGTTFARPGFRGVGSEQFAPTTTQYLGNSHTMSDGPGARPAGRRLSSFNANTQYLVSAHRAAARSQKSLTPGVRRHSTASATVRKRRPSNAQRRTPPSRAIHRQASSSWIAQDARAQTAGPGL